MREWLVDKSVTLEHNQLMQNLNDHLADPAGVNAFNYATKFT